MVVQSKPIKNTFTRKPPFGGFFISMKTIDVAVAVIINKSGQVLLTQRNEPKNPSTHLCWQLPGGGVEKNESVQDACVMEAYEETGLHVSLVMKEPYVILSRYENRDYLLKGFKATVISGTINTDLDSETNDAKWYDIKDISSLKTLQDTDTMVLACVG